MRQRIDSPDILNAELHRRELRIVAGQVRRREQLAGDVVPRASSPVLAERSRLYGSLAQMWEATSETAIERADPLGVWSYDLPRRRLVTLDRWTMLDWGVWTVLVVLAGYLAAGR